MDRLFISNNTPEHIIDSMKRSPLIKLIEELTEGFVVDVAFEDDILLFSAEELEISFRRMQHPEDILYELKGLSTSDEDTHYFLHSYAIPFAYDGEIATVAFDALNINRFKQFVFARGYLFEETDSVITITQ